MIGSLAGRKVRTLDDTLRVFQDRDLNSPVIGHSRTGVEIQLGAVSEIDGREWVEATLPDGTTGYLVSASARSHTEETDASGQHNLLPQQQIAATQPDAVVVHVASRDRVMKHLAGELLLAVAVIALLWLFFAYKNNLLVIALTVTLLIGLLERPWRQGQ